tara:strand:- start:3104 stop:4024 length:921 start_codon:yes stop_codon:yes gene_type:complete
MHALAARKITATSIQQALSKKENAIVKNRNLIKNATAIALGFESFEQADKRLDRIHQSKQHMWVERSPLENNCWCVIIANIEIKILTTPIDAEIKVITKTENGQLHYQRINLPRTILSDCLVDESLYYDHKKCELTIRDYQNRKAVSIWRDNVEQSCHIHAYVDGKHQDTTTLSLASDVNSAIKLKNAIDDVNYYIANTTPALFNTLRSRSPLLNNANITLNLERLNANEQTDAAAINPKTPPKFSEYFAYLYFEGELWPKQSEWLRLNAWLKKNKRPTLSFDYADQVRRHLRAQAFRFETFFVPS